MMRAGSVLPTAILRKDLRLRMRGWRWAGITTMYVAILGIVAIGFLRQKFDPTPSQSSQAGIQLLQTLSICQLLLIVFVTPSSMAGLISAERQARTWDLLLLSRLSALDIVSGKLLVGLAFNLILMCASLPLFGLVFLYGGVSAGDVLHIYIVFICTVLLLGSMTLAVSALTARLTVSFIVSLVLALTLTVGLSILAVYLQSPGEPGVLTLAGVPFQTLTPPSPLTPLAHLDPLAALLSALPAVGGGSLLGDLGSVHQAFALPWQLPLWGAYGLLSLVISLLLLLGTGAVIRPALHVRRQESHP